MKEHKRKLKLKERFVKKTGGRVDERKRKG